MQILMDPPRVIRFGAKTATTAKAAPTAPVVPPPPPPSAADRWIGAATQGGGFGLKGVYVVTPDGYLHEQIMANGKDYAPAVKLINSGSSGGGGAVTALNMSDKILYLESDGCSVGSREIWSIDLNSAAHTINSHAFQKSSAGDVAGPMIGNDGTVYVSTGNGVIALTAKELKNKDYFAAGGDVAAKVGPVAVGYNDKEFIVAAGKGGSIALLDAALLKTPVSETGKVFDVSRSAGWQALASWREKSGSAWVLASVNAAASGKVVAFKIGDESGHAALTTAWSSGAMRNVAPPVIANGIVFALEGGDAGHHAVLHALDAATGKELYSSGDAIDGYSTMSGLSVGDGHVFFATHDGVVYAFGIPLEH
jgi:outer membrane protein assembly factor BamB